MKKSDLYREWARVLDMCEGTGVNAWECVRRKTGDYVSKFFDAPDFDDNEGDWSFAIAILEGKPLFVGDEIYNKSNGAKGTIGSANIVLGDGLWSWQPPKKTFLLNGVELPCPGKCTSYCFALDIDAWLNVGRKITFYYNTESDRNNVADAIIKLLAENTK